MPSRKHGNPVLYLIDQIQYCRHNWQSVLEHLKPRSNNIPREVKEHFELPLQPLIPVPSSSIDIPFVSTPAKGEIPKSPS